MWVFKKLGLLIASCAILISPPLWAGNDKNYTYLALGDSISFGLNPNLLPTGPGQPLPAASEFIGYPEIVAQIERLQQSKKEVNASCPGETSGSFLDTSVVDNGCNSPHFQAPPLPTLPPFKTSIGLHTNYTGSQMLFAAEQLSGNKHINLVTLSIGGNDILLLLAQCAGDRSCVQDRLPGVVQTYAANLTAILSQIRQNYKGTLVVVTYYAPTADLIPVAMALNSAIGEVGSTFDVKIADAFKAFTVVSSLAGGDACQAGLLVRLSDGTCDFHPSLAGQGVLATSVEIALGGQSLN